MRKILLDNSLKKFVIVWLSFIMTVAVATIGFNHAHLNLKTTTQTISKQLNTDKLDIKKQKQIQKEEIKVEKEKQKKSGEEKPSIKPPKIPPVLIPAVSLFTNNIMACIIIILTGLIPIPFIYYWGLVQNAVVIGLVLSITQQYHVSILGIVAAGLLPHGILEISMLILSALFAGTINRAVFRYLKLGRKEFKPHFNHLCQTMKRVGKRLVVVIVPGILIAACIEAYITPILLGKFL